MKRCRLLGMAGVVAFVGMAMGDGGGTTTKSAMVTYNTPYYTLSTDVDVATAREADLRMTRMYEEYKRRTASFSGEPKGKFPFFMFTKRGDYNAAGGPVASDGVFDPNTGKLMAWAQEGRIAQTWETIQHEGFHQFAAMTIQLGMPAWMNEGLAEYFGGSLFTGDCFVTGAIPSWRLKLVKKEIEEKKWKSFSVMTTMSQKEWNAKMSFTNYTQAWAMVHFLVNGEDGKYQKAFDQYILLMSRGKGPEEAWVSVFGKDVSSFQAKCEKWWTEMPENPTKDVYAKAVVAAMTSLLARQELQKKKVEDFEGLMAAPLPTDTKLSRELWLPPSLVEGIEKVAPRVGTWKLERAKGQLPKLTCVVEGVGTVTGTFVLNGNRVEKVGVSVVKDAEKGK